MMQKAIRFFQKEPLILGPFFLFCTVCLAAKSIALLDLLALGGIGFFLSAKLQMRGCVYSLILLGLMAAIKHAFFIEDHLWHLGIESSLACAFLITACAFEQDALSIEGLYSQIGIKKAALENLEEELSKVQQGSQELQIQLQEKIALLQKELEELQVEHSSILMLNEVLRKKTALHLKEKEEHRQSLQDKERELCLFLKEFKECEQELNRFKNQDALAVENRALMKELNQARYDKEQTSLINATLARLHLKESLKGQEAEKEIVQLEEALRGAQKEITSLKNLKQEPQKQEPQLLEELEFARAKMHRLFEIEPLFKQLKKQFEEKTELLHQTRKDLFQADTELKRLNMLQEENQPHSLPKELILALEELEEECISLKKENEELEGIVSLLCAPLKKELLKKEQELSFD